MTLDGVRTVAEQELRLRIRAGRWRWLLGIWFAVVSLFALLLWLALRAVSSAEVGADSEPLGPPLFGGVMLFVLGLGLLIVPALTAQSVNGDRERGTLATLQVTLLSAGEIAVGKLAAAWGTALTFLALTLPAVLFAATLGGLTFGKVVITLLVVALLLGVVCALAQALSALLARSITSALLAYLTVFVLTLGSLISFGIATALTTERVTVSNGAESYTYSQARPDRTWPLLAPNPFVVLADAAPRLPPRRDPVTGESLQRPLDPLGAIGDEVRKARRAPMPDSYVDYRQQQLPGPVWPYGLAFDVLLAAGAVWVTVRRLRTPVGRLPRGVRIA